MIELSATAYYWFISLGLIMGATFGLIIKSEGVSVAANIIWSVIGSTLTGTLGIIIGLGDGLLFAIAGTLGILFLVNVFHQHHKEDVLGHGDQEIHIVNRYKLN